jgi:hypothetical protein
LPNLELNTKSLDNRHRWYAYKESFLPDIVHKAINDCDLKKEELILDIFNGSGTVTLASSIIGYKAIGLEVNPFSSFVSKAKLVTCTSSNFLKAKDKIFKNSRDSKISPLLKFSTFSEKGKKPKWLFNSSVLNAFETYMNYGKSLSQQLSPIFKLAMIGAAMDNCNAVKDGKCLKYRRNWDSTGFNKKSFLFSLEQRLDNIEEDLKISIVEKAKIINCDSRVFLNSKKIPLFKLCLTSPPYLNSFDYTDIYRPELFLGEFIRTNDDLRNLRFKTLRSHVEIKLQKVKNSNFGLIYQEVFRKIEIQKDLFWDKQIPLMIEAYFEDMKKILVNLLPHTCPGSQAWLIVSNSAYNGIEIPVDLILADIGCQIGWNLHEIEVLRYINKRITNNSREIKSLRESIVKFVRK